MMTPDDPANAEWRREQRKGLIARREAIEPGQLQAWRRAIDEHLRRGFPGLRGTTLAICWPYRNEYDARHLAAELRASNTTIALPVVVARGAPLQFREWRPGVAMAQGDLGIPYPSATTPCQPRVVLLPMVGFDAGGYRLGYGGGYFDRTLAALHPRPAIIGVAHELARIATIHPQSHDIAVDYLVTERGVYCRDNDRLEFLAAPERGEGLSLSSPVCYLNAPEIRRDEID
ncbi:MAG: 5-formyltetrahydrofolate cyclo-ligase [Betaproteobacteria bacterium]|nr:5-formyltetrahydrofolate cyclo-ligase [Betaproteobacteria bacterium]